MNRAGAAHRVLGVIGEPMNGVGYVRFHLPFGRLKRLGFTLETLGASIDLAPRPGGYEPDRSLLDGVSLLMLPQMVASPVLANGARIEVVETLCDEAVRRGIPIVYSADDHLIDLEPHNPGFETIRDSAHNLEIIRERADAVIVTTPALERSLAAWGKPVHVLPNAVDPAHWQCRPRESTTPRVGWAGSSSHLDDLLMVLPAIRDLQRRVDCEFVMLGLTELPLCEQAARIRRDRHGLSPAQRERARAFERVVSWLRKIRHTHVPFGSMRTFFGALPQLDLDIGICPLLDSPFNRHKSALKFYEYVVTGSMTVASDVSPYAEEVTVTVENDRAAWTDALERYLSDADAREHELERQRAFVHDQRDIRGWVDSWAATLTGILERTREGTRHHAATSL